MLQELNSCLNFYPIQQPSSTPLLTSHTKLTHNASRTPLNEQYLCIIPFEDLDQFRTYKCNKSQVLSTEADYQEPLYQTQQSILTYDDTMCNITENYQNKVQLLWSSSLKEQIQSKIASHKLQQQQQQSLNPTITTNANILPDMSTKHSQKVQEHRQTQPPNTERQHYTNKAKEQCNISSMHRKQFSNRVPDQIVDTKQQKSQYIVPYAFQKRSVSPINTNNTPKHTNPSVQIKLDINKFISVQQQSQRNLKEQPNERKNNLLKPHQTQKSKSPLASTFNSMSKSPQSQSLKGIQYKCQKQQGVSHININLFSKKQ